MGPFVAILLTIAGHAAVLNVAGPYGTLEQCRSEVAHMAKPPFATACVSVAELDAATQRLFSKSAADIWK